MLKQQARTLTIGMTILDIVCLCLSWYFAHFIRYHLAPEWVPSFYPEYFYVLFPLVIICIAVLKFMGLYSAKRTSSLVIEIIDLFKALSVSLFILLAVSFFYRQYEYSRLIAFIFWMLAMGSIATNRVCLCAALRYARKKGYNLRSALIVGAGDLGKDVKRRMEKNSWLGVLFLGFIDDDITGTNVVGTIDELDKIVDKVKPDYLYITLPFHEYPKLDKIVKALSESMVSVRLIPDIYTMTTLCCGISNFVGYPMIHITDSPLDDGWNRLVKRIFDIFFSFMVLFFTLPILIIIALGVKLSSRGPIFYRQKRMGLDGQVFQMLKFRTMPVNSEKDTGPVWAAPGEKRATAFGSFLRKTSIDELPQFWNVLTSEMSVVGPRPERPYFIEKFKKEIPKYMLRHKMKAGITGWAQVNGWRGKTSLTKRIEYDIYYIEHWSFGFDIKIIVMTLFKGFISDNAY